MKLDITLPTSLSEIPLSRYQQFIEMKDKSNDEEEKFIKEKLKHSTEIRKKNANLVMRWMNDILAC